MFLLQSISSYRFLYRALRRSRSPFPNSTQASGDSSSPSRECSRTGRSFTSRPLEYPTLCGPALFQKLKCRNLTAWAVIPQRLNVETFHKCLRISRMHRAVGPYANCWCSWPNFEGPTVRISLFFAIAPEKLIFEIHFRRPFASGERSFGHWILSNRIYESVSIANSLLSVIAPPLWLKTIPYMLETNCTCIVYANLTCTAHLCRTGFREGSKGPGP